MMYQCTKLSATFNVKDKRNFEHKSESVYYDKYGDYGYNYEVI